MTERDYGHRDVLDKLGIKAGHAIAFTEEAGPLDAELRRRGLERAGRVVGDGDREAERLDVVLVTADASTDAAAVLARWRARIAPAGGIWLLTPKRGQAGYVDQRALIVAGLAAGLVDNKVCSVSETTSAMRFVIRRADRPPAR